MFIPTIQGQSDDEQLDEWLSLAIARGIIGTYAQTELGHGTNLKNLETTATYDPKTEEFIINSPTITSAKWWPGGLGKSSNYAIVVAQLYTLGICRGPHPFIVQLRDLETHMPLRGVRVGDIGPKFGFNSSDNGFLLFDNYRIPRSHMLMRHSKVLKDGTFIAPKHSKLSYGTMVFVRSIMIKDQATELAAAACIAIRYSAIRRQGEIKQGSGEVQILDYQTQQFRLLPQLARSFAFMFAAYEIRDLYMKVTEQLADGNTELLPEIHALSSGLKSVVSWEAAQGIEQCRLACGGHGYSLASAFPEIYAYSVGGCTYEGENIVMLLQVARWVR
ncbi:acyl-CoA dehydrogenase, middle domain protein [Ancylostoma ceylanicum]|uniref:Acyl-CoA dehydrogenase, middle domain protein n=1 Tax=Ancylostoma ceylanicum TaxID=53326 RepID=A0A0D6LD79_9BILA|nr:acyl-CoA dehydrogenase, middle domain protein [Ancylostoma ceylanicum]